jgi:outer membrane lipoprotein-sorting protein
MKLEHFLPLVLLAAAALGCSQLRDMANRGDAPTNSVNSGAPTATDGSTSETAAGVAPSGDPNADINRMADAFLEQKSFRAKMVGSGQTPMDMELEFVAPDRFRMKNTSGPEMVIVGKNVYVENDGRWQKLPGGLGASVPDMRKAWDKEGRKWFTDVKYVGEENANGKPAHVYTYHNKGAEGVGENDSKIWIAKSNGLPVRIEATYKSGPLKSMTVDYDYEAAISIEPPVN